jgi:uncharacterized protein YdiU (UPF0061 family)
MTDFIFQLESTYAELPQVLFSKLSPTPVRQPEVVLFNEKLADEIGLNLSDMSKEVRTDLFAGNFVPEGTEPFAQAYAGHQFGNFTMLGDGRAIVLGEHLTPSGQRLDLQLKVRGERPIPGVETDGLPSAPCFVNISLAKPCTLWESPPRGVWRS